ncbi:MAG: hypothetical protein TH68_00540 [Candidatus Synechococcus spongiarum 142]|uniref:AAA+ ATPase domain-containing protein n=1 Tax=Candidatus Synechococcus spongiarum 142 TaxID=1608213 RepID=A0A6N3XDL9_9SYNE|nr:MAG: hypothetical protein TH68_00540 [Candidatus Synechococcus spongiarum 142]
MLHTLALHGFRGFASYQLNGLSRVNLLVGKNNCGKTSVLEAIELLASEGDPRVLYDSIQRRGESDVAHIFHGHACDPGVSFDLSSDNGKGTLTVKILTLEEVAKELEEMGKKVNDRDRGAKRWRQRMLFDSDEPLFGMSIGMGSPESQILLPVMEDGTIRTGHDNPNRLMRNRHSGNPVHFLTMDTFDPAFMGRMWDTVLKKGLETEIVTNMRLLEPDLDSIHFLTRRARLGSGILLGFRNDGRRLPIETYGDGMRKLLALRLSFVGAENGVLLIDEIDAGLHWTVMEEMWQFVVEVACQLKVQVFATTHSYDCIRGLGSLIRNRPDMENQVSLQKMTRLLPEAVCLQGDQIKVAVEQDIEVR